MQILEGKNVTKHFGGLAAVHQVDFNIHQGEVVGLIGPNGAGKTTLFNLISGSLPATGGEIRYKGKKITGLKPHQICKKGIARTFQSAKLFAGMSVFENALAASLFGTKRVISVPNAEKEAEELLEFVELSTVREMLAKDLPIADRKRIEVARALATKPELLMFDEVMAGLNPTEIAQAMELITKIQKKGITIFMIEHVMKAIMNVCDRIIVLHHGSKIAEGTPGEIATSRTVIEVYLGE
ncbi:MAG TPA: ABC transporter ATP-binding protein [Thermodesulfobacteriota bacterium]|nr:ABC transporter ATP-binding protein [Thermodesulfobacteriota bacterium]